MTTRRRRVLIGLLYQAAAATSAVSAIGFTVVGAAADVARFAELETDAYARAHLRAALLVGTTAFALTAVITMVAGLLRASADPGSRRAGRLFLLIAAVASLVSVAELLILTPTDAIHAVPFLLSPAMIALGLAVDRQPGPARELLAMR